MVEQIKGLEPERKCFRMVGGILVERNVKEALTALTARLSNDVG